MDTGAIATPTAHLARGAVVVKAQEELRLQGQKDQVNNRGVAFRARTCLLLILDPRGS